MPLDLVVKKALKQPICNLGGDPDAAVGDADMARDASRLGPIGSRARAADP